MTLESINEIRVNAFSELFQSDSPSYVTTSKVDDVTDLAVALEQTTKSNPVKVLTNRETMKEVRRRFLSAAFIADFINEGSLEVRTEDDDVPSLLVREDELVVVTGINNSLLETFSRTESPFVEDTYHEVKRRFDAGSPASFRTPAYSVMLEELGKELGDTMESDVESMLNQAFATRDDESSINPVRISILAGAKNEVQFYDLGRWGEYNEVGSKSTFSREKNRLENLGIIKTEKVQTGVGRPRHKLVLGDEVAGTSAAELLSLTEGVLE